MGINKKAGLDISTLCPFNSVINRTLQNVISYGWMTSRAGLSYTMLSREDNLFSFNYAV